MVTSEVRCKWFACGPADATANPIISCFIKIQIGLTFLVPAYPDCPGKEAVNWASVLRAMFVLATELDFPHVNLATYGGRAFAYAGPTSWNFLPDDSLKDINLTLQTFKRHLKTFLFSTY